MKEVHLHAWFQDKIGKVHRFQYVHVHFNEIKKSTTINIYLIIHYSKLTLILIHPKQTNDQQSNKFQTDK